MYSKRKIVKNIILVGAILALLLVLVFTFGDIKRIWEILTTQTNWWLILLGVAISLAYCICIQLSFTLFIRKKHKDISFIDTFNIGGSEFFFNAITPFSSGGQPFQAYSLKRKGMKYSDSTSALLINFIVYQTALNLISVISLIMFYNKIVSEVSNVIWLLIFGFSINIIILISLILLGCTKVAGRVMLKLMDLLCKIKFLNKHLEKKKESFSVYVSEMQTAFKEMTNQKLTVLLSFLLKVIGLLIYYSIPYFIFLAIGVKLELHELLYIVAMTSFSLTMAIWVPTPGASGGVELAFKTLFVGVLTLHVTDSENVAMSGMVLWRFLTYYLMMLYGFIVYLIFERSNKDEDRSIY